MTGRVGIHDVAVAAGVSTTTVSHAMNGRGKVSARTREHVRSVARELGYQPNRIASALRARRTGVLGFLSDEIATTPFAGRIVLGAQEAAADAGVVLMVVNSGRDPEVERRQLQVLKAQQIDGLVYATMFHRRVELPATATELPAVLVNAVDDAARVPGVVPDETDAGERATGLLLAAGHRRIVHLTIDEPGFGVDGRAAGYAAAMRRAGLEPHVVAVPGPADATAGRAAFAGALSADPATTAAYCFNDPMAMGVYQAVHTRGGLVPDDLSVVGVDNLEVVADQLLPGLTTLALPHYEMGRWAVTECLRLQGDPSGPPAHVALACPLVERGSVRGPR